MSLTYGLNGTPARAKTPKPISIKLIGVGGAGCNAVDRLLEFGLEGVEYLAANTDAQALRRCHAPHKILLGRRTTRGMGTGGNARTGAQAARESYPELTEALLGADLVFLAGGMGGGTGSGAIPVVAELVRSLDSLALAIVTTPFGWEGHPRQRVATAGILQLQRFCDTLVVVPNDKLLQFATPTLSLDVALRAADDVLRQAVQGLTELVSRPGVIQVDFSAVQALLRKPGGALLTVGHGKGENKVADALHMALQHPLHDAAALDQATGLLAHFSGGADLSLHEINDAISKLRAAAHPRTEMVWGTSTDEQMSGRAQVILMATGVGGHSLQDVLHEAQQSVLNSSLPYEPAAAEEYAPLPDMADLADNEFYVPVHAATRPTARPAYTSTFTSSQVPHNLETPAYLRRTVHARQATNNL